MPAINIMTFRGQRPRVKPHLLPTEQASIANNTEFERGCLQAYRGILDTSVRVHPTAKTIFRYLNSHWFQWNSIVDAIKSPVANDEYQRVYYTGDGYPKVTNNTIFSGPVKPAAFYRLGVPADETGIVATAILPSPLPEEDDFNDNETRFYTHTYVTGSGEEGPPSPPSNQLEILYPGSDVDLVLPGVPTNNSDIQKVRIYRTSTGGGASDFYFVHEMDAALTTFTDSIDDAQLGPSLTTEEYEMPDEKMRHLTLMANGIVAGAWGNTVAFCEPYLPYAWPTSYQLTTEHNVVAMSAVDNYLLVVTEGHPWLFHGVTSDSMSSRQIRSKQACVSKRSMANIDGVLMYASPDGLVAFTGDDVSLISGQVFTRKQWARIQPETIEAYYYEGMYLAFYGANLDRAFLYSPGGNDVVFFDLPADCGQSDLLTDTLYLSRLGAIGQWNSGAPLPYTWRSKEFIDLDAAYSCAYVRGDVSDVGLRVFVDGRLAFEFDRGTLPTTAFRLPALRGNTWQFELFGTSEVLSLSVATSMSEVM